MIVDPKILESILSEQRAARAALDRIERRLSASDSGSAPEPRQRAWQPPSTDRKRGPASAVKADVLRVLAAHDGWLSSTHILHRLEVYATLPTLAKELLRLAVAKDVSRRASLEGAGYEYRIEKDRMHA